MKLSFKQLDDRAVQITISDEFTFSDNSKFREMLKHLDSKDIAHIRVEFADCDFVDSAALGMLLLLKERADQIPAELELANAKDQVLKVLELSRFQDLFQMTQDSSSESAA